MCIFIFLRLLQTAASTNIILIYIPSSSKIVFPHTFPTCSNINYFILPMSSDYCLFMLLNAAEHFFKHVRDIYTFFLLIVCLCSLPFFLLKLLAIFFLTNILEVFIYYSNQLFVCDMSHSHFFPVYVYVCVYVFLYPFYKSLK